jgi:monoamine oxidase
MPLVEPVALGSAVTTAINIRTGQSIGGKGSAHLAPASSTEKPPKMERAAEADARRASALKELGSRSSSAARAAATARAAKPDAL